MLHTLNDPQWYSKCPNQRKHDWRNLLPPQSPLQCDGVNDRTLYTPLWEPAERFFALLLPRVIGLWLTRGMDALRAAFMDAKVLDLLELADTCGPACACTFESNALSLTLRRTMDASESEDEVRRKLSTFDRFDSESRDWTRPEREGRGDGGGDCVGDEGDRITTSSSSESGCWMRFAWRLGARWLRQTLCRLRAGWWILAIVCSYMRISFSRSSSDSAHASCSRCCVCWCFSRRILYYVKDAGV